jgi:hypothetical protein
VTDFAARSAELGLAIKIKRCTSYCLYTFLLIDVHISWFFLILLFTIYSVLCVPALLWCKRASDHMCYLEGNNDPSSVTLYKLNFWSPTKLPYYRRIHVKPCPNRQFLLYLNERKLNNVGSAPALLQFIYASPLDQIPSDECKI